MTTPSTKIAESMLDAMAGNGGELPVSGFKDYNLPWHTYSVGSNPNELRIGTTKPGQIVATVHGIAMPGYKAKAEFIVLACNSHQALVDALERCAPHECCASPGCCLEDDMCGYWEARAALALAGETK